MKKYKNFRKEKKRAYLKEERYNPMPKEKENLKVCKLKYHYLEETFLFSHTS